MNERLTLKDYAWTVLLLLCLFVLLPLGLWQFSLYREVRLKASINAIVPDIVKVAESSISKAEALILQEVLSYDGHSIYSSPDTREAIELACENIRDSISSQNSELRGNKEFCDFYILRGNEWIRADYNTIIGTQYPDDLKDFADLLSSSDPWRLYPNGRNWRVKYKLRSEPQIILDFEVGSEVNDSLF